MLKGFGQTVDLFYEDQGICDDHRYHGKGDQRQGQVQRGHEHKANCQQENGPKKLQHNVGEKTLGGVDVAGGTLHQITGLGFAEITVREILNVLVKTIPQRFRCMKGRGGCEAGPEKRQQAGQQGHYNDEDAHNDHVTADEAEAAAK